ncbi:hypothetical protein QUF75_09140 [Desulfococcaceae bacterium HSG7]|nr:hypothetical protein [Desulfococcaceae bacterium HSG7]
MKKLLLVKKTVITLLLILLTGWLLQYTWQKRSLSDKNQILSDNDAKTMKFLPEAQYLLGLKALSDSDAATASTYFRQAVSQDVYHIDAWLKLAEAENALGNVEKAKKILQFTHRRTKPVRRWKWSETLLAYELRMEKIFVHNINYMVQRGIHKQDALQLADAYTDYKTALTIQMLDTENMAPYLQNLMRLTRQADASLVWDAITETGKPAPDILLQYVNFLVNKKKIIKAYPIWREYTDTDGITNPDFEKKITRQGFDWRFGNDSERNWVIKRVTSPIYQGEYALQVTFGGKKNISFHHLYQIVPVKPLAAYTLTFVWQSVNITTDQGPFIEIYGYDQTGLSVHGRQITGTDQWHTESIQFKPPANCHAVVIRLRRMKSKRFDSKIAGVIRLDNFRLSRIIP